MERLSQLPTIQMNNVRWKDEDEVFKVRNYLKTLDITFEDLCRCSVLEKIKREKTVIDNISDLKKLNDNQLSQSRKLGSTQILIQRTIEKIKRYNETTDDKVCITKGIVLKLSRCNYESVKRYFNKYRDSIESYNEQNNLSQKSNLKGSQINIVKAVNSYG